MQEEKCVIITHKLLIYKGRMIYDKEKEYNISNNACSNASNSGVFNKE